MDRARFEAALAAFDRANAEDPNREVVDGVPRPRELVQAERLYAWVERLEPSASEPARLAARCQHIRRWEIPRSDYPKDRVGYLRWRTALGRFHADAAARILGEHGYERRTIDAVRIINLKQGLKTNPDTQLIEDALCLSFLEHEFEAFAAKHPEATVLGILRKTWQKMTPRGRTAALGLKLSGNARRLLDLALGAA
jgi:Domain of unknown function (DUF4202)